METIIAAILIIILVSLFYVKSSQALKLENKKLEMQIEQLRSDLSSMQIQYIRAEENLRAQQELNRRQEDYLKDIQQKSKHEFESIAGRLLEEKSARFTEQNRANLDTILSPLKENIKAFEQKINQAYQYESNERNTLKGVISQLMEQNLQIREDAINLTRALKGDTKKQGNWGEIILERILEHSGLVRDREYRIQVSLKNEDGLRMQPDVIIDLPDQKHLVIDAKVSLSAYERMTATSDDTEREHSLKQHIASIKAHVQGLSLKNYSELYGITSPDFVLLFIPIESSFGIAVQNDNDLFNYAWDRKVVIVSPSTLLATLRTISSIWKHERQTNNVMEIARLGGSIYDKLAGFIGDMENIGKYLRQGSESWDKAMNKLHSGNGNLVSAAEKIRKLGAKTSKQINTRFSDPGEEN